jgi:hypothetical protein
MIGGSAVGDQVRATARELLASASQRANAVNSSADATEAKGERRKRKS